uniref:Uncharacterized protein n=1 Tax=Solibacter usitatus (strain Ellin6076) TaxID=234267 RepID=Q027Z1_SOLUE
MGISAVCREAIACMIRVVGSENRDRAGSPGACGTYSERKDIVHGDRRFDVIEGQVDRTTGLRAGAGHIRLRWVTFGRGRQTNEMATLRTSGDCFLSGRCAVFVPVAPPAVSMDATASPEPFDGSSSAALVHRYFREDSNTPPDAESDTIHERVSHQDLPSDVVDLRGHLQNPQEPLIPLQRRHLLRDPQ